MNPELRRYPRIDFEGNGELVLPDGQVVTVAVRCLSCIGAGIEIPHEAPVYPSELVDLRIALPEGSVELAARVAWVAGQRAGLSLRLPQTEAEDKRAFGAFIAPRTKQALAQRAAP